MHSIHGKITLAFTSLAVLMAALAMFAFLDMLFLENRVHQGLVVAKLEYAVMEMRLQEKNLFLYGDREAGARADGYADQAQGLLSSEHATISGLVETGVLNRFDHELATYRQLLDHYLGGEARQPEDEKAIRSQGQRIFETAEGLVLRERQALAGSISASQWALAISILVLALLVFAVGRTLARSVVAPLRRLSSDLQPIAEGRFDHLDVASRDAEMVAFGDAFNCMLDELEVRRRRLVQSEKLAALGVLVAGVAHELNNPLSNISSSAQLLIEELDEAERKQLREWALAIDNETERARRIVDALQSFGRGKEAVREPVNLQELLNSTLLLLRGPLRKTGAQVDIQISEPVILKADAQRLQQVFINLINNAALSGNAVTITISATVCGETKQPLPDDAMVVGEPGCHQRGRGRSTQIMVEDNGAGITGDILQRVFDPFYTSREPGQGMGLGLYIVQEIIQEHDGCIAIASHEGQGTRVFLHLPCMEEAV